MFWEGIQKIILSKSKTFLAFCFCFMVGAGLASWLDNYFLISLFPYFSPSLYLYSSLFVLISFSILLWKKVIVRFFLFCILFFVLGSLRFLITLPDCNDWGQLCYYNGKKVTLVGTVSAEPDMRIGEARYVIAASQVMEGTISSKVQGKVLVTTRLYPAHAYGEHVQMLCPLKEPENRDDNNFRYDKYLAKEGVWSVCSYPKSLVVIPTSVIVSARNDNLNVGQFLMQKILWLKSKVQSQIDKLWPEPESSLMAGLLYGSRSSIPQDLKDNFNKTGLTHIIAISGFNITIIVVALMSVLIYIGLWRQQAYWIVVIMTILFVVFTGATASVTRAAVMGLIILTAQQIGRLSRIGNALVFTAAVMTLINPYVLVWDAGFQLSFLATLGLVYISPVLQSVILNVREGSSSLKASETRFFAALRMTIESMRTLLLQTLSAILVTLPLILYQFGRLSLVAPLVNVLILWIIPLLMLVGFVAIIFSFIFFPLGQLIAWVAHFGLQYVIMLVNWFGGRPWAAVEFRLPLWAMLALCVLMILYVQKKHKGAQLRGRV